MRPSTMERTFVWLLHADRQVFLLLVKLCFSPRIIPFVLDRKLDHTSNNVRIVLIVSLLVAVMPDQVR